MQAAASLRRILLALGATALLGVAALAAIYFLVDVNRFKPVIEQRLAATLGRQVTLGTIHLKLIPFAVAVRDVRVAEDPAFPTGKPFLTCAELRVRAPLRRLLQGELRMDAIEVDSPAVELVQSRQGAWNFSSLGAGRSAPSSQTTPGAQEGGLELTLLTVRNASLAVSRLGNAHRRTVYTPLRAKMEDLLPEREFRFEVAFGLPGGGELALTGHGGPLSEPASRTPLSATLTASRARWGALTAALQTSAASPLDANLNLNFQLTHHNGRLAAAGSAQLTSLQLASRRWPHAVNAQLKVAYDIEQKLLTLQSLTLRSGAVPLTLTGALRAASTPATTDLRLELPEADLTELMPLLALLGAAFPEGMELRGKLAANLRAAGPLERLAYDGTLLARQFELRSASLTQPLRTPSLQVKFSPTVVRLEPFELSAGQTRARAALTVLHYQSTKPKLEFSLSGETLDLAEIEQLAAPVAPSAPSTRPSPESPPWLTRLEGRGQIAVRQLHSGSLLFEDLSAQAALQDGVLALSPLSAQVFGGAYRGALRVNFKPDKPLVEVASQLEKADMNRLLTATSSLKDKIFGLLAANLDARLSTGSPEEIARSLNGTVDLDVTNGRLMGYDLLARLGAVARFAHLAQQAQTFTQFTRLKGKVDLIHGLATTNNLELTLGGLTLAAAGSINLPDEKLDLRITAVLSRQLSEEVGGTRVGGYLTSALMNRDGELVIPALVTGTLSNPLFAPDTAAIARLKLQQMLPSRGNPGTLWQSLSGTLEGKKPVGQAVMEAVTARPAPAPQDTPPSQEASPEPAPPAPPPSAQPAPPPPADSKPKDPAKPLENLLDIFKKRKQP